MILRGSLSLLVDANNKGLQTTSNTLNTSVLSSKETRRVSKHLPTQKVNPKNTSIPNRHMYGREVSRLFSGDHFGEEALLQREDRALHTAQTNDMVELLVIDADIFAQCLHPYFEEIVLKRAEFLAGLEWFRNWSPHLLRQLTFMLRERHYQFEECLYRQGMSVPGIWFIRSGSVRISTQHDSQTPKELLDKIEPPIDYLPEILAEDLPEQTTSKSSIFSNTSQRSSIIEASAVFLNKPSSQTSLQKEVSSPTKKKSTARKGRAMMGYVIHRPNPKTNVDLCILGPGDILCDNEAVCRLRKHLFNAVCESNVVVYELNRFYFELMFENQVPRVLHQMSCRAQQRVESWEESVIHQMSHRIQHQVGGWGEKHFEIRFFVPLMTVLKQTADKLETEGAHKIGRKKALYNPEMLAWTAIKGLGKTPKEASVTKEVHVVIRIQSAESCSSQLAKCPPTPIPVSPFEPRVPDFEMMSSMMRFTDPRFNALRQRNEKTIFDSPLPARGSSGHVLTSDVVTGQDSIPVPAPYPARKSASLPILKKEVSVENEAPVEDKPEPKIDEAKLKEDEFAKRFPTANDPDTLASIKLGLKFGKTSALTSCGCTSMQDAKERLKQTRSQSKQSGAKSAEKGLAIPILTTPTLRSISLDRHMRSARQSIAADRKDEETDTTSKTETRVSFSMDHELTDIPKEYSRLCGKGEWHSQRGAGGCAVCRQHYRDMCSNTCTMPFMKTMMKVIENRTSSLLTKYVKRQEGRNYRGTGYGVIRLTSFCKQ